MSTADVAADVDELREALGDDQLTYLGYSYGTEIGAAYATLFPDRTRAIVLDGSVSPNATDEEELTAQAKGFDRTYANFVEACDSDPECPLGPDTAAAVQQVRDRLERSPLEVRTRSGDRTLGRDLFDLGVATALYDTSLWSSLTNAIADLEDGGAEVVLSLVDRQTGRQPDGTYDNSSDAQVMVSCADTVERPDLGEATAAAERIEAAAPTFGGLTAFGLLTCVDWPLPANPLPEPTGAGAPPVLVVGTLGDPATPYEWSEQMRDALESAVLLTYEGDGHTAFLRGGECIERAVVDYLVELIVPAEGTSCPAVAQEDGLTSLRDELVAQLTDLGTPEQLAECVVDGAIDDVGEAEFERMVLGNDQEELTRLFTAQALRCAARGN
jgi:pimeloyl-ACP methyl ester carboxylesterase